jgi:type I protein arginine methyltransferase
VYRLTDYVWMLADDERIRAYSNAIRNIVKPGDRVLEIGTGIGFFSVVAVQAGASHVEAVDVTASTHLAPRIADANGCADRVTFRRTDSRQLVLDKPADVLLSDLRGPLPFCGTSIATVIDARTRLVRPGGAIIAARDVLYAAPCSRPDVWSREVAAGLARPEVRLDPLFAQLYDTPFRCCIEPQALLADAVAWLELDYSTVETTDHAGRASWTFERGAAVDGLALWFESDIGGGARLSAAPTAACKVYRQLYLPFRTPVAVEAHDTLTAEIGAWLVDGEYVWTWRAWRRTGEDSRDAPVASQNSIAELVVDPAALDAGAAETAPAFGPAARALASLITTADGRRSIADLAGHLQRAYPAEFPDIDTAGAFVRRWVSRLTAEPAFRVEQSHDKHPPRASR